MSKTLIRSERRTEPADLTLRLPVKIRRCREPDLALLEWEGLFTEHRNIFKEAFERHQKGENLMLVAEANQYPIGQVWIDFQRQRDRGAGYLWAVRVQRAFQGLGLGQKLMEAAETELRERGFSAAELGVEIWNTRALSFYQRQGYNIVSRVQEVSEYINPQGVHHRRVCEEWLLRKNLESQLDPDLVSETSALSTEA